MMLKSIFDAVMERRARRLMESVSAWLPARGPVLDVGSGTGHLSALLERERGLEVVATDVSDIHVVGRPPVLIADGAFPFDERTFRPPCSSSCSHYPNDAPGLARRSRSRDSRTRDCDSISAFRRHELRVASHPGICLDVRRFPRVEAHRLRPLSCGVHHARSALLYRRIARAGRGCGWTSSSRAARAANSHRTLIGRLDVDARERWLTRDFPW